MTKYVLIVQDREDDAPYIYPGESFNTEQEARNYAWNLLKDSYGEAAELDEYDSDEIENLEDPEAIIYDELAHYYGANWDFRYLVDTVNIG
jgi:hypothetical protein